MAASALSLSHIGESKAAVEVEGKVPGKSHMLYQRRGANPTFILPLGYISNIVNLVFDPPIATNACGYFRSALRKRADVIASFMGEHIHILQQLLAGGLHSNHTVEPWPIWQVLDLMTHLGDSAFDAPMSLTNVQVFLFGDKLLLDGSK